MEPKRAAEARASTTASTERTYRATRSWAPISVRVTRDSPKPAASGSASQLRVGVEVAARGQRVRGGRRSLGLGRRREDRDPSARRVEHAPELAQHAHRILHEEERDDARDRGELAVGERQLLRTAFDDVHAGGCPRERHHLGTVVEAHGLAARLERSPQEDTAAAADVEEAIARPER